MPRILTPASVTVCLSLVLSGCGGDAAPENGTAQNPPASASPAVPAAGTPSAAPNEPAASTRRRTLQPITLGGGHSTVAPAPVSVPKSGEAKAAGVLEALRPLQMVLVSDWHGISRQTKGYEELNWKWDLLSDRQQPALVMTTEGGRYFRDARLTWRDEDDAFRLTATDADGVRRVYRGTFAEPVRDVTGDDDRLQRTYKLRFEQIAPADDANLAQVVLNQQTNNRYLMEVYDRRGERMQLVDVVSSQRAGTSFALDDSDYGEKTCIISQGLGTMSVSHAGKTYYVCCTGCQAAFEDDPQRWIAKLAQREKMKP